MFINLTIYERVELLSYTLINIFINYIPNKTAKLQYGEGQWQGFIQAILMLGRRHKKLNLLFEF